MKKQGPKKRELTCISVEDYEKRNEECADGLGKCIVHIKFVEHRMAIGVTFSLPVKCVCVDDDQTRKREDNRCGPDKCYKQN